MPLETIICNAGSKLTIQWGKAQPEGYGSTEGPADPSVILTSLKAWSDPSGAVGGWDVVEAWHLDADTIIRLLPILRRACNQAYGTNLAEMTAGFFLPCTCGVIAGGARSPRPDCAAHSLTVPVSFPVTVSSP